MEEARRSRNLMIAPLPPSKEVLAGIAAQLVEARGRLVGEMPFEVEMFVLRYGAAQ